MQIFVPTPSDPETKIGSSYPRGTLYIPPNPPMVGTFSFSLSTKALPASMSTPDVLDVVYSCMMFWDYLTQLNGK